MAEETTVSDMSQRKALPAAPVAAVKGDIARVVDYIGSVSQDHVETARLEAERIRPYLSALSRQLFADLLENQVEIVSDDGARFFGPPKMPEAMKPRMLSRLFTAVARDSQNTILSEMIVAPLNLIEEALSTQEHRKFFSHDTYNDRDYGLGFIQLPAAQGRGSVSVSVFSLSDEVLKNIPEHAARDLLQALQKIVTAGNHDMQHHYTNKLLNPNISKTSGGAALNPDVTLQYWSETYFSAAFSDKSPYSYESWLMLNHQRVFEQLGHEHHQMVYDAIESYFDTLKNVSAALDFADADYLSWAVCFAMQRYLRLDNPLMLHALERMEEVDKNPSAVIEDGLKYADNIEVDMVIEAYPDLFGQGATLSKYQRARLLQMAGMETWSVKLLAPIVEASERSLKKAHEKVAAANLGMVDAAVSDSKFFASDGECQVTRNDGTRITYRSQNGGLHAEDRPAFVIEYPDGDRTEEWYRDGQRHNEGGPAYVSVYADSSRLEKWYRDGKQHREDGPAQIEVIASGTRTEKWYRNGEMHREDGPAYIYIGPDSERHEEWYRDGKLHHEGGPAYVSVYTDSSRLEKWYRNGEMHREDGPAYIYIGHDGEQREEWYRNGEKHREDGPAVIEVEADGSRREYWRCEGEEHREDGPAYIYIGPDGERHEEWYRNGREYTPDDHELRAWEQRNIQAPAKVPTVSSAPFKR